MLSLEFILSDSTRLIKTFIMFLTFTGQGLVSGLIGPSMLDIVISTNSTLAEVSTLVVYRSGGAVVGTLLNPLLLKLMDVELLLGSAVLVVSIVEAITLFFSSVYEVFICFLVNGFCFGIIETGVNILLIRLWGKDCAVFLQSLYFGLGLGCVLSPLIAGPLLTPLPEDYFTSEANETISSSITYYPEDVKVHFAYVGVGVFLVLTSFSYFYIYMRDRNWRKTGIEVKGSIGQDDKSSVSSYYQNFLLWTAYSSAILFSFIYCGIAIAVGSFLTAFTVGSVGISKSTGAYLTSNYWVSFTFSRLLTIFYYDYVGPKINMTGALILTLIANIFLLIWGVHGGWALWFGIAFYGVAMSSLWATLFSFIAYYIPMTNCLTSLIMFGCCLGESGIQILISLFIESTPMMFIYVSLSCSVVMILSFAVLWLSLHHHAIQVTTVSKLSCGSS